MMRINTKELKERFATVFGQHIELWESKHPKPKKPKMDDVLKEITLGYAIIDKSALKEAIEDEHEYDQRTFNEVVSTPLLNAWRKELKEHETATREFRDKLTEAKNTRLDRALFDHESAYVMLTDFQKWQHQQEVGDGCS